MRAKVSLFNATNTPGPVGMLSTTDRYMLKDASSWADRARRRDADQAWDRLTVEMFHDMTQPPVRTACMECVEGVWTPRP